MEPSEAERAAIRDIPTAATWARLPGAVGDPATPLWAILSALGEEVTPQDIVAIPDGLYEETVRGARVCPAEGGPPCSQLCRWGGPSSFVGHSES